MKLLAAFLAFVFFIIPMRLFAAEQAPKPSVTCMLSASKKLIEPGESVTITWNSTRAIVGYGPHNTKISTFGSMRVSPMERTIYKFKFLGVGESEKCGIRIRVIGDEVTA